MPVEPSKTKSAYLPALDGLRFIAFLLVFIHHAQSITLHPVWTTLHAYGWMGVELFFCLSAFLFAKLLHAEYVRTGSINIRFFYIRRGLRIWPLYYCFVLAAVIHSYRYGIFSGILLRTAGMLTFTDDILVAALGYCLIAYSPHLWTIAYEEQFYAVIPWALRRLFRMSPYHRLLSLLGVVIAGSLVRAVFIWKAVPHPAIWVLPITHFDSILFGLMMGLGFFDRVLGKVPPFACAAAGVAALMFVGRLPSVETLSWWLMVTYPLVGLGMTLIVYGVLRANRSFWVSWLSTRPMAFLGKISFGLYVYHIWALQYCTTYSPIDFSYSVPWVMSVFGVPLSVTILVSSLSYFVLEKPFLLMKDRFTIVASRPA